jgi:hypothetical protein
MQIYRCMPDPANCLSKAQDFVAVLSFSDTAKAEWLSVAIDQPYDFRTRYYQSSGVSPGRDRP